MAGLYSAPYYEIRMDFEFSDPIYYSWSKSRCSTGIIKQPYPDNLWVPRRDIEFTSGGMWSENAVKVGGELTPDTVEKLLSFHCIVEKDSNTKCEVISVFSSVLDQMPLVSCKLRNAISDAFPKIFEFVELPEVWNETASCPLPGGPYNLANLLTRVDSWDKKESKFYEFTRRSGSRYTVVKETQRFIDGRLIAKFPIWRDSVTSNVICTERFRWVAEDAGCKGWRFSEIPNSL